MLVVDTLPTQKNQWKVESGEPLGWIATFSSPQNSQPNRIFDRLVALLENSNDDESGDDGNRNSLT